MLTPRHCRSVCVLLALCLPVAAFAESVPVDSMDGSLIETFFLGEGDFVKKSRLSLRPLLLSQAQNPLNEEHWNLVVRGMPGHDLPASFTTPDNRVQRFETQAGEGAEVFVYFFTGKRIAEILFSAEGLVLDKRLL